MKKSKKKSEKKFLKYALSHLTPSTRSNLIVQAYQKLISPNQSVLDIGCGSGRITADLIKHINAKFVGCDILNYTTHDIPFKLIKHPTILPFGNKKFDISLLNDVLHHMDYDSQEKIVKEALRVSSTLLIFETRPTILGQVCDYILSKCYIPPIKALLTFRNELQWKKLFNKMGIKYTIISIPKPLLHPFENVAFQLKLKAQ